MKLIRALGMSLLLVGVVAGCGDGGETMPATPRAVPSLTGSAPADAISPEPSAVLAGQTQTEWGRIWQSLPDGFPVPAGSTPDEEAATPASAVLVVEGTGPQDISRYLQTELEKAGYTAVGSSEPLEDGSVVLDMAGTPDGCALQVTSTPTGGLTTVRILYGAACPIE